ncbi:hypothetical protein NL676_020907 [Syzygium grande]|nr:hypothetical protein NL676_020907 [Syzygium grande]
MYAHFPHFFLQEAAAADQRLVREDLVRAVLLAVGELRVVELNPVAAAARLQGAKRRILGKPSRLARAKGCEIVEGGGREEEEKAPSF